MTQPLKVVLVGQTPPPVHGQALAIERLVEARFERIDIHHVPMEFSGQIEEVGRFSFGKIARLLRLVWRTVMARFSTGSRILYYPPAGPNMVPVLRDIAFLSLVRPFYSKIIFEFHAGGLEGFEERLPIPLRLAFRHAYHHVDLIIEKFPSKPNQRLVPSAERRVVPNGVDDEFPRFETSGGRRSDGFSILYVGTISKRKGVLTLLAAVSELLDRDVDVRAVIVGAFASGAIQTEWTETISRLNIAERVEHRGQLTGDAKWREFAEADALCFLSELDEACPLSIIEAMQFRLPVVASNWAGIPYLVRDGETGFLVPKGDPVAPAARLQRLANDPELRMRMGAEARRLFLEHYTSGAYLRQMEDAFTSVALLS